MANLNDLNLVEEDAPEVDVAGELPQQFGSFIKPLQPGTYTFRLPVKEVLGSIFEPIDVLVGGVIQRAIAADFKGEAALDALGHGPFEARITTKPRPRGKDKILVSDATYLLQALGHGEPVKGHKGQAEALISHGGETFAGDVSWSSFCSVDKDIYVQTDEGSKKQEGTKGCGRNYANEPYTTKDGRVTLGIPKSAEGYADRFACHCGATLRAYANLSNFRASKVR